MLAVLWDTAKPLGDCRESVAEYFINGEGLLNPSLAAITLAECLIAPVLVGRSALGTMWKKGCNGDLRDKDIHPVQPDLVLLVQKHSNNLAPPQLGIDGIARTTTTISIARAPC